MQPKRRGKRKAYTAFTAEQRATIGKYTSEHGNAAAVKKFKADFDGGQLGERINKNRIYLLRGQIFKNRTNFSRAYNCTFTGKCWVWLAVDGTSSRDAYIRILTLY